MTGKDRDSPEYLRTRAKEARTRVDREATCAMLEIAGTYDKLAERAERKLSDAGM